MMLFHAAAIYAITLFFIFGYFFAAKADITLPPLFITPF